MLSSYLAGLPSWGQRTIDIPKVNSRKYFEQALHANMSVAKYTAKLLKDNLNLIVEFGDCIMLKDENTTDPFDRDYCIVVYRSDQDDFFFGERDLSACTFEKTVADIASGELIDVVRVFRFSPIEGHSGDITEDVAIAALEIIVEDGGLEFDAHGFPTTALSDFIMDNARDELETYYEEYSAEEAHEKSESIRHKDGSL